jgi:flagellar assembly factor FliW
MHQAANAPVPVRTVHSRAYGDFQVTEDQIYHFPRGLVGLHEYRDYALIRVEEGPFHLLHALNDELSFILLPAHLAADPYGFRIDDATVELLQIGKPEDVAVFVIVNAVDDRLYVNLKAPVLTAPASRRGCQFIIDDPDYPIRHPLSGKEGS